MRHLTPFRKNTFNDSFFRDFDSLFDSFIEPTRSTKMLSSFVPRLDIQEHDNHYLASFDVPGLEEKDIKVEVKDNHLVVSGERVSETKESEGDKFSHYERHFGKFQRVFTLPDSVNASEIEAHYDKGVLSVLLPKSKKVDNKKTVEVKTGEDSFFKRLLK